MADPEQAKPLAPASFFQSRSDREQEALSPITHFTLHQTKFIKCFGCCTALLLIISVTILILFFTVFHVKNPVIKMNDITLLHLEQANGTLRNNNNNITLAVNVSVKNPNVGSFKFNNGSAAVFYGGFIVGEAITPSGMAKARHTVYMNVTVNLIPDKLLQVPGFSQDVSSGKLSMNSSAVIGGKVEILSIIKRYRVVEVNCSMTYSFSSLKIQQDCRPNFI